MRSWEINTSVVLVMASSSSVGHTGMSSFPLHVGRPVLPGMWGAQQTAFGWVGC